MIFCSLVISLWLSSMVVQLYMCVVPGVYMCHIVTVWLGSYVRWLAALCRRVGLLVFEVYKLYFAGVSLRIDGDVSVTCGSHNVLMALYGPVKIWNDHWISFWCVCTFLMDYYLDYFVACWLTGLPPHVKHFGLWCFCSYWQCVCFCHFFNQLLIIK